MNDKVKVAELLPCQFCGGEAERIDFGPGAAENEGGSCIACKRCQASGPVEFGFKENFIANWNRRAALARQEADKTAAPVGQEWTDEQCIEFASCAFRNAPRNPPEGVELTDIRMAASRVMRSAPPAAQADDWHARAVAAEKLSVPHGYKLVRDSETPLAAQTVDLEQFRRSLAALPRYRMAFNARSGEMGLYEDASGNYVKLSRVERALIDQQAGKGGA